MVSFVAARSKPELVLPSRPTPRELKTLSGCDMYPSLRFYATGLEFFRCTGADGSAPDDPAKAIKAALAEALVHYYPMAGRLRELPGTDGKLQLVVDCTAEGVVFVEADADVGLEDLGEPLLPPYPCSEQFICDAGDARDIIGKPLIFMQVTRLSCGGFVIGVSHCHTMADGFGIMQLLAAITELARGDGRPSVQPVWERELLAARDPPRVTQRHLVFEPLPVLGGRGDTLLSTPMDDMAGQYFFFGAGDVAALRSHVLGELGRSCTAFELIAAAMWRGRTAALACPTAQPVRLKFTMNARGRWKRGPPLPRGFYGNAFAWPAAQTAAGELVGSPLGHAVELLREAKHGITDESMASMLDLFALQGSPPHVPDWTYVVSDISRLHTDNNMKLGWSERVGGGMPMAGDALTKLVSFHMRCRNSVGEDCIVVSMFLPKSAMVRFAEEMTAVLSPNNPVDDNQALRRCKK